MFIYIILCIYYVFTIYIDMCIYIHTYVFGPGSLIVILCIKFLKQNAGAGPLADVKCTTAFHVIHKNHAFH